MKDFAQICRTSILQTSQITPRSSYLNKNECIKHTSILYHSIIFHYFAAVFESKKSLRVNDYYIRKIKIYCFNKRFKLLLLLSPFCYLNLCVFLLLVFIILSIMVRSNNEIFPNSKYFGRPLFLFSFVYFFNPFRNFHLYVPDFAFQPTPPEKIITASVIRFC